MSNEWLKILTERFQDILSDFFEKIEENDQKLQKTPKNYFTGFFRGIKTGGLKEMDFLQSK